jgi:hypothetical protein
MGFGEHKQLLNHAPIENRSLFSVKKRVPNPRVPEPAGCYSVKNSNARVFLILMPTISQINCSGANSVSKIGAFLSSLHRESIPELPGVAMDYGII